MHLIVFRSVAAELLRHDDLIDTLDSTGRLLRLRVDEVHLKADEVEILGWRLGGSGGRRVSSTYKYGEHVRVLATGQQVGGVMAALGNLLGFAKKEWEDRHDDVENAIAPPWRMEEGGSRLLLDVRGYWFTLAQPEDPDPPLGDDAGQTDPDA